MAAEATKSGKKAKKQKSGEVTFKCRLCEKQKPISEMRIMTRYRPVIVVCRDCEKTLR
jgi:predicted SprT family Zn-dependent metalloprotease